jgi:hypothetical protein
LKLKKLFIYITLLIQPFFALCESDKYRVIWVEDPSSAVTIGWNAVDGIDHRIYLDTIQRKPNDTSSYSMMFYPTNSNAEHGMQNQFALIKGLKGNCKYYLVFADNNSVSEIYHFKTASDDMDRISIIAGGDSRNNREVRLKANVLVSKLKPDGVMFGGDYTMLGTDEQWAEWFDDWQLTTSENGRLCPLIPTRGNHEFSENVLRHLFNTPKNDYYSIILNAGLLSIYTLNTEISIAGEQSKWLREQVSQDKSFWKMAQYHRPMRPHVKEKGEGDDQYMNWAQLFYDYEVRVVMESDAHTVKMTYPIKPDLNGEEGFSIDSLKGTVYLGEGTWGAPVRLDNDLKQWTKKSGEFNQFKWIWIDKSKIEIRTVKIDVEPDEIQEVDEENRFIPPNKLSLWEDQDGSADYIYRGNFPFIKLSNKDAVFEKVSSEVSLQCTVDKEFTKCVKYFSNGIYLGKVDEFPFEYVWKPKVEGHYSINAVAYSFDNTPSSISNSIEYYIGEVHDSLKVQITEGKDDAEESTEDGVVEISGLDLEIGQNSTIFSLTSQIVGLRFQNIKIPTGAHIDSAFIQFHAEEDDGGAAWYRIYIENKIRSEEFKESNHNLSNRDLLETFVTWKPSDWKFIGQDQLEQRTPDLSNQIQKIIDQEHWISNGSLSFIFRGTGERSAYSYEGSSTHAPELNLYYSIGSDLRGSHNIEIYKIDQRSFTVQCGPCIDCSCELEVFLYNLNGEQESISYLQNAANVFTLKIPDQLMGTYYLEVKER